MKYREWIKEIPEELTADPLWNMNVYRYSLFLSDIAWDDISELAQNQILISSCDQRYRFAGSVSANVASHYSQETRAKD